MVTYEQAVVQSINAVRSGAFVSHPHEHLPVLFMLQKQNE